MTDEELKEWYYSWLQDIIFYNTPSYKTKMYDRLIRHLMNVPFAWVIRRDANRADDGISLRNRFAYLNQLDSYRQATLFEAGPCTILEMMVALAIHCEDIMQSPFLPDQTSKWFWEMIESLGLSNMTDRAYNEEYVDRVLYNFMDRNYQPDGKGGLFTIENSVEDLRDVEIWIQMNWYLCNEYQ